VATVRILPLTKSMTAYFLSVQHSNYAGRVIRWQIREQSWEGSLPGPYTVKLSPGITIGGFVREENGQPVAGATVKVWGSDSQKEQLTAAPPGGMDYASVMMPNAVELQTDARGSWTLAHFPAEADQAGLEIRRTDGARASYVTGSARGYFGPQFAAVQLADLHATNAVCVLKEGVVVRGIVVDEAGAPLAGARVSDVSPASPYTSKPEFQTTGADGRFALPHRIDPQIILTAEAPGYAIASTVVAPTKAMTDARLVLARAAPARLKVVGERDEPVAGAQVWPLPWRNRRQFLEWQGETDSAGRVVWTNAPRDRTVVQITSSNYPSRSVAWSAGAEETVVRLRQGTDQAIVVRVRAIAEPGGASITNFEVLRDLPYGRGYTNWGKAGLDGRFQQELQQDAGGGAIYSLRVQAEGYRSWTSSPFYFEDGDQDLTVSLPKARPPAGVVLQPDGQPAGAAKVILNTSESPIYSYTPGEWERSGQGAEQQFTSPEGGFRFRDGADEHHLIITHRTGFAALTVKEFLATGKVKLQAWGQFECVLQSHGKPLAGENVSVKWPLSWMSLESHHLSYNRRTDADGRVVFTNLPPGEYVLYRMPIIFNYRPNTESYRKIITIQPGKTTTLNYSFGGRTVIGQVEADGAVDWKNDPHLLVVKQDPPPPEPIYFGDAEDYKQARKAYAESPARRRFEREQQQFLLRFDSDGNFQADDVPPGVYELRLTATKPPASGSAQRYYGNPEEIGSLIKDVTVPPGAPGTEVDLGHFEIAVRSPASAGGGPFALQATTLAGRPFDLADLRGRPVVILFWARWAPASVARLEELRAAAATLGPSRRSVFLTVNLDDDLESAQKGVQGLDQGWTHTRLEGPARFEVTERLQINTLPCNLLLRPNGAIAAHDIKPKQLAKLLDRLSKGSP
jgi:protocatechuate 3,4-dioxygenase beta subunit